MYIIMFYIFIITLRFWSYIDLGPDSQSFPQSQHPSSDDEAKPPKILRTDFFPRSESPKREYSPSTCPTKDCLSNSYSNFERNDCECLTPATSREKLIRIPLSESPKRDLKFISQVNENDFDVNERQTCFCLSPSSSRNNLVLDNQGFTNCICEQQETKPYFSASNFTKPLKSILRNNKYTPSVENSSNYPNVRQVAFENMSSFNLPCHPKVSQECRSNFGEYSGSPQFPIHNDTRFNQDLINQYINPFQANVYQSNNQDLMGQHINQLNGYNQDYSYSYQVPANSRSNNSNNQLGMISLEDYNKLNQDQQIFLQNQFKQNHLELVQALQQNNCCYPANLVYSNSLNPTNDPLTSNMNVDNPQLSAQDIYTLAGRYPPNRPPNLDPNQSLGLQCSEHNYSPNQCQNQLNQMNLQQMQNGVQIINSNSVWPNERVNSHEMVTTCVQSPQIQQRETFFLKPDQFSPNPNLVQHNSSRHCNTSQNDLAYFHHDRFELLVDVRTYVPERIRVNVLCDKIEIYGYSEHSLNGIRSELEIIRSYELPHKVIPEQGFCFLHHEGMLVVAAPWAI